MKKFFLIFCFVSSPALALIAPTTPSQGVEIGSAVSGHLTSSTVDFIQMSDGSYAVHVFGKYQAPHFGNEFVDAGIFLPTIGAIVLNGDRLFWILNDQSIEVAQTYAWSTFPKWSSTNNVVRAKFTKIGGSLSEKYTVSVTLNAF